jgi:uncharacterized protein (DUF1330 family)
MTAYIIFTREKTLDPVEFATYAEMVPATRTGHDSITLARYGDFEVLEGDPIEGAVILQFPTFAAAKAWYGSPAYQAAAQHRFAGARYRAFIIEGVA